MTTKNKQRQKGPHFTLQRDVALSLIAVSDMIKIQLPDGSIREVAKGTTPFDIANSISPRLAAAVVVARVRPLQSTTGENTTDGTPASSETQSEEAMYSDSTQGERIVDLNAPLTEDRSEERRVGKECVP